MKTHIIMKQFKLIGDGVNQIFSIERDALKSYRKEIRELTAELEEGDVALTKDFTIKLLFRTLNEGTGEKTAWDIFNQCTFFAKKDSDEDQDDESDEDQDDDTDEDQDDESDEDQDDDSEEDQDESSDDDQDDQDDQGNTKTQKSLGATRKPLSRNK